MLVEIAGYCEVCHKPIFWRASDMGGAPSRSLVGVCVGVEIDGAGRTVNPGSYRHYECRDGTTAGDRIAALEASLLTIQSSIPKYLKQEMTAEEFALEVIGAVGIRV